MFEDNGGCKKGANQHRLGRKMRGVRGTQVRGTVGEEHFRQKTAGPVNLPIMMSL